MTPEASREVALRRSAGKRFYEENFSGLNLSNADFRGATLHSCNFTGADLSYANFDNANCWGSDFQDAICYRTNFKDAVLANTNFFPKECFGMTLSMNCNSFEGMRISNKLFQYWMFLATMMSPEDQMLLDKLIVAIGAEDYAKLAKVFRIRSF